jgi:hypothetical protein
MRFSIYLLNKKKYRILFILNFYIKILLLQKIIIYCYYIITIVRKGQLKYKEYILEYK